MKVTIITVFRFETHETLVNVVAGELSATEMQEIADQFELVYDEEQGVGDLLGFRTLDLARDPSEVVQAFPEDECGFISTEAGGKARPWY